MPRAHVAWVKEGGRTRPPPGPRYACTATVGDSVHWSFVVEQDIPGAWDSDADVRWLVDAVPIPLEAGTEVEMFEGNKLVARAVVRG